MSGRFTGQVSRLLCLATMFVLVVLFAARLAAEETGHSAPAPQGEAALAEHPDLGLTAEEKAFLAGRKIRLGVDAARPPFEFFDERGVYSGITAGVVEMAARRLGIEVVPLRDMRWTEAMRQVKTGGVDVIPKATPTPERSQFLIFTHPYITFPTVIVTRKDRYVSGLEDIHGLRVGVVKGLVPEANLRKDHPDMPLIQVPDLEAGLRALSTGKLEAFVDNLGAITYTIDSLGLTNLKIAAPTPYTQDLAMGVRKDWPLLASALDKALASISNRDKAEIKSRWLAIQVQARFDWAAVLTWGLPLGLGLLVVLLVVVRANRRLGREVAERKKTEKRLQAMAANVPGAIFQMEISPDGQRRYLYLSPGAEAFFGVAPELVMAEKRILPWHPDDLPRVQAEFAAPAAQVGNLNLVGRLLLPDGRIKWVQINASGAPGEQGGSLSTGFMLDVTQRKLAELEYLASERKIKAMSQAVEDALIMLDGRGRVLFWNPAAERLFGYAAEEAMGMDFHDMAAPPQYRDKAAAGLPGFARTGQGPVLGTTTEIEAQDRQGRQFPVEVTLSSFQVDEEWFAVGTVRDISARKRDETVIRESQRRLAAIIDFLPDPALVVDRQGVVLSWNRAMERLTGVPQEQMLGKGDYEYALPFHGQRRPILVDLVGQWNEEVAGQYLSIKREGDCLVAESYHPHLGESGIHIMATATALYDAEGRVAGAIETLRDITREKQAEALMVAKEVAEESAVRAERARAEAEAARAEIEQYKGRLELLVAERTEELKASEERSRLLLHCAGEGIFGVDEQGCISFVNPAALAMLGYGEEEMLGRPAHALLHHSRQDGTPYDKEGCPMYASYRQGTAHHISDEVLWRRDGRALPVEYSSTPIRKDGRLLGAVMTFRDVSERKRAEEEMRQYMDDLQRFNRLTLGREVRMIELKEEVNSLLGKLGQATKYRTSAQDSAAQ